MSSGQELLTVALDNTICPVNSIRWINPRNGSVSGGATVYGMACVHKRLDTAISVYIYSDYGTTYVNNWNNATNAWSGWDQLALTSNLRNQFAQFAYSYNSVTIPANSGLTVQPTSTTKPDGYATLGPLEIATGSISVITRGFKAINGELYLVNTSSSSVTVTPTFSVMLYKTAT